jgi:heme exporter protein A
MDNHAAVELRDVSKRFGTQWALARVSYSLPRGESLLLTGANGSGKTTLLRLIATAASPTAGELRVLGLDGRTQREDIRQRVGLLSHASFVYEDLSANQNLTLISRLLGLKDTKEQVASLLSEVGLPPHSLKPIRQFSAGMRKRLAIARLLLKAPELALLDEPFGALDPRGISQMETIIRELSQKGITVILATHLVEQGKSLCKLRLHLHSGRIASP